MTNFIKKIVCVLTTFFLVSVGICAQTYQSTTDVIYGQQCFVEIDDQQFESGDKNGTNHYAWPQYNGAQVCYYLHVPVGYCKMSVFINNSSGASLKLRVIDPDDGSVIYENEKAASAASSTSELAIMTDVRFKVDKWYRFEFTTPSYSKINYINKLVFSRESTSAICVSKRFMAPSVHLWTNKPEDPMAPSGDAYDWSYQEVMYPSRHLRSATYVESMAVLAGYMGIQYEKRYNGVPRYKVLFSMWDNGNTDEDPNLPDYLRSGSVDHDPNAAINRFGNEGTGIQAIYEEGQWWHPDKWVQFLFNARPEIVDVTIKGSQGQDSVIVYENTLTTAWYKMEDDADWTYIATHRASGKAGLISGFYSFLENYADNGEKPARAYYRKGYMRSAASGKWYNISHYSLTNNDGGGKRTARHDYGRGCTDLYSNTFYLENGGYTSQPNDSSAYVGVPLDQSCVDTINIDAKVARVNEAIKKNTLAQSIQRLSSTGETYDLTQWTLLGFSDQDEDTDGVNGLAANAIDGDKKTFWQNKWRNGGVLYPHWIALKAPREVSLSQIDLYSSKTSYLFWPAKMVIYTSKDGNTWTKATDTLAINKVAAPSVVLDKRLKSQYYKIEFTEGFSVMLYLNEITLSTDCDTQKAMDYAAELISKGGCFDSYRKEDLEQLANAYDNGAGSDEDVYNALTELSANATPLKYGRAINLSSLATARRYQLFNPYGNGCLVVDDKGKLNVVQANVAGTTAAHSPNADVTLLRNNWMIVKCEGYNKYYLYNPEVKKYLDLSASGYLSDTPAELSISCQTGKKQFYIRSNGQYVCLNPTSDTNPVVGSSSVTNACYFYLYDNYYLTPTQDEAQAVLAQCDDYAKFDTYKTRLGNMLNVEQGLVGSIPEGEERNELVALYNNGNIALDQRHELYHAVDSCYRVPFDPSTYVYKIVSNYSSMSASPFLTGNATPAVSYNEESKTSVAQIWSFRSKGEGMSPTTQDIALGRLPDYGYSTVSTVKTSSNDAGIYYVTESAPGIFKLSTTQHGGIAYSSQSASTSSYYSYGTSEFRMRIADKLTVQLNSIGLKGVNYNFDVLVPEDLKVYVVDHIDNTTAYLLRVYDRLPAGTPAIIRGTAFENINLEIAAPSSNVIEDNMLKGTYFSSNVGEGTLFTLKTTGEGIFSKALTNNVPANSVYMLFKDDVPSGSLSLDFSDTPTAISSATNADSNDDAAYYDLQGKKLSKPQNGLYIHKGKVVKQ